MKRSKPAARKVALLRSYVGKDKEFFKDVYPDSHELPIEDVTHVTSRTAVTTNVTIPNQVSDDPREVALKGVSCLEH